MDRRVLSCLLPFAAALLIAAAPSPSPTATPPSRAFTLSGKVRAFDFTRQNASSSVQGGANKAVNQQSFNIGIALHGEYRFDPHLSAGATYFYANPLNACADPKSHLSPPCGKVTAPGLNPDDSVPGFALSTLDELYLRYRNEAFSATLGDQLIATPWASASDTRLKPAAYRGIDAIGALKENVQFEVADMTEYEPRTSSQFDHVTLITGYPAGNSGPPPNIYVPGGGFLANNGFAYGRLSWTTPSKAQFAAHYYAFDQIANMLWLDARVPLPGALKPYVGAHFLSEHSAGTALVGKINSQLTGVIAGIWMTPTAGLSAALETIPLRTDTIALPAGYSCKNNVISGTAGSGVTLPYYLPSGGTSNCSPASGGLTNIYYGGIASPYTDNYTSDPLYTTSLTQGLVERRSPGSAVKITATFTSEDKRFVGYISRAFYNYNNPGYAQGTYETNVDATYYFSRLVKDAPYRGFVFRYRYGERTQSGNANIGGSPLFKYNRFQSEYDF